MPKHLSIKTRLIFLTVLLSAVSILVGAVGLVNQGATNAALGTVYHDRLLVLSRLSHILSLMQQNQNALSSAALAAEADNGPVIADVDTGIDDALALLLLARDPRIDLLAVTCVDGNVDVDTVVTNTRHVLATAGRALHEAVAGRDRDRARGHDGRGDALHRGRGPGRHLLRRFVTGGCARGERDEEQGAGDASPPHRRQRSSAPEATRRRRSSAAYAACS